MQNQRFTGNETFKRSFEELTVADSEFEEYILEGANLMDAVFERCTFKKVDFYWASMFRAKFVNCSLEDVDLRGANMEGASFTGCRLVRCDFSRDNLGAETNLSPVRFEDTEQVDCIYSKAKVPNQSTDPAP
jgi:uncharacterized protein YjbI with pentapeptide repeats